MIIEGLEWDGKMEMMTRKLGEEVDRNGFGNE